MSLWTFLVENRGEVAALTLEHLFLVAVSTGIAVLIGIPVGIFLTRRPALSKPVLGVVNVLQTVPSLALFGFLIPVQIYVFHVRLLGGIGARTAIVALVLYALLPIIRNTFAGIQGVDPAVREAARAMGMTGRQLLLQVELPLALAVIIAGVRVATVISVGTATIAAAIDAGGLGRYIFRGLRMNDNTLILAGAAPAAALALAADFVLGLVERWLQAGRPRRRRAALGVTATGLAALMGGAIWLASVPRAGVRPVSVGAKDFTEQIILGELLAQAIESELKIPVDRRFDLGGNLAHEALVAGEIDLYPEYTGTALTVLLKEPPRPDPREVYQRVSEAYAARFAAVWTEPLGFENTFAILVRGADARRLGLERISAVAPYAPEWRAGFGQDFISRPDGYAGFVRAYGLRFKEVREMDLSLTYKALAEGQVDLIAGNSTDGLIERYGLAQLRDDRRYFPPYDAAVVVREDALQRYPGLRELLRRFGGAISVEEMRRMNLQVDGERRNVRGVAREFLRAKGFAVSADRAASAPAPPAKAAG